MYYKLNVSELVLFVWSPLDHIFPCNVVGVAPGGESYDHCAGDGGSPLISYPETQLTTNMKQTLHRSSFLNRTRVEEGNLTSLLNPIRSTLNVPPIKRQSLHSLLAMVAFSAVYSFAMILIHNVILFINTSTMFGITKATA